jgi:hypothetical protein
MIQGRRNSRNLKAIVGLVLLGGLLFQGQRALSERKEEASPIVVQGPTRPSPHAAFATPSPVNLEGVPTPEMLASRDPIAFFEAALEQYDRSIRDYTCTFTKQELVNGQTSKEQVISAMFREQPFSVRLEWLKNEDKASRVLYVRDRWVKDGKQMAVVEPGPIARLLVPHVMRQIDGREAERSSRRTIDQFGLRNSIALILKYSRLAREQDVLRLLYAGNGMVDSRETLVFERHLPYEADGGPWPDRVLVIHMDRELLVPTLCLAYADDDREVLLGKYMLTDIKLNVNLPDSVFTKEGMGL